MTDMRAASITCAVDLYLDEDSPILDPVWEFTKALRALPPIPGIRLVSGGTVISRQGPEVGPR